MTAAVVSRAAPGLPVGFEWVAVPNDTWLRPTGTVHIDPQAGGCRGAAGVPGVRQGWHTEHVLSWWTVFPPPGGVWHACLRCLAKL